VDWCSFPTGEIPTIMNCTNLFHHAVLRWTRRKRPTVPTYSLHYGVMYGKLLFDIWLVFRILGLEMNFDNFISVTRILCWHIGSFKFAFRYENG